MERDIHKNITILNYFYECLVPFPRSYYNLTNKNNHLKLFFIIDLYMSQGNRM